MGVPSRRSSRRRRRIRRGAWKLSFPATITRWNATKSRMVAS
ncbi:MAG: 50S ribosomal protein L32 [Corynebacterium matruchotii]